MPTTAEIIASAMKDASDIEKEGFKELWNEYLENIKEGLIQILLPELIGRRLGLNELNKIALNYSQSIEVPVRIAYDSEIRAFRIGEASQLSKSSKGQTLLYDSRPHEDGLLLDNQLEDSEESEEEKNAFEDSERMDIDNAELPNSTYIHQTHPDSQGNSTTSQTTKSKGVPQSATKEQKIPKPLNSFILFRKTVHETVKAQNPNVTNNEISQIIGEMWRADANTRDEFKRRAAEEKRVFMQKNPGWICSPRKSSDIRRRNSPQKSAKNSKTPLSRGSLASSERAQSQELGSAIETPTKKVTPSVSYRSEVENSSLPLPTLDFDPWLRAADMDSGDFHAPESWLNSLPVLDAQGPTQHLQRRNVYIWKNDETESTHY